MLPGQISPWQLASVKDGARNLPLKFGKNRVSNSWDITYMDKCRHDKCCIDKCHQICSRWSKEPTYKVWSISDQYQMRYTWYGQISPWQMSPWQFKSVQDGPRNLPLKFGPNWATNSWDIYCSGWVGGLCVVGCAAYESGGWVAGSRWKYSYLNLNWFELNWIELRLSLAIFLIWTNVARTNVAWTNVTVTVGIC